MIQLSSSSWLLRYLLLFLCSSKSSNAFFLRPGSDAPSTSVDEGTWQLDPSLGLLQSVKTDDAFGARVAMSGDGNVMAISAPQFYDGRGKFAIYGRTNTSASSTPILGGSNEEMSWEFVYDEQKYTEGAQFGASLALSADGSTLVVGSPWYGRGTLLPIGRVDIYQYYSSISSPSPTLNTHTNGWISRGTLIGDSSYGYFGRSLDVSADGSVIAIGATFEDEVYSDSGRVTVYAYNANAGAWTQRGGIVLGDPSTRGNHFGTQVSLSQDGTILAVGGWNPNPPKKKDNQQHQEENAAAAGQVTTYVWNALLDRYSRIGMYMTTLILNFCLHKQLHMLI
jgi:hypothetical protein